ncbi:MAG: 23S rRNA (adenine(1618)-N(6))-methyltransferase RlmF [Lutibacter sp.]|nr:23S rRNA (adenine(1618)-N(6))-methyltransferase RlmF [Lutibacter sp.]
MVANKKSSELHPNNRHNIGYDFKELYEAFLPLKAFVFVNTYGTETIDFANQKAVKSLNTALLFKDYKVKFWEFPDDNLCPPIPGRVDYIHYLADLLKASGISENAKVLDIGTGANCIYPLLGNAEYGWQFVGTEIDAKSLGFAEMIVKKNGLDTSIKLLKQFHSTQILKGILDTTDKFSATMCNPPFYGSQEEAMQANTRKLTGLGNENDLNLRNFGGKQQELWYKGGEKAFLHTYLYESSMYKTQVFWYSSLVSKKENVEGMCDSLKKLNATDIKIIPMHQGNKITRIVAWTFLTEQEQKDWKAEEN